MKHLYLTLGTLREQRVKLNSSIEYIEALLGVTGNGKNGKTSVHRAAEALLADATETWGERMTQAEAARVNGHTVNGHKKTLRRGLGLKTDGKPRQRTLAKMKPLPEVEIPKGLDVSQLQLAQAVVAALKAYKKPADTHHLAALLLGAGYKWDRPSMPFTTRVGSFVGREKKSLGVKGDRNGWALRG